MRSKSCKKIKDGLPRHWIVREETRYTDRILIEPIYWILDSMGTSVVNGYSQSESMKPFESGIQLKNKTQEQETIKLRKSSIHSSEENLMEQMGFHCNRSIPNFYRRKPFTSGFRKRRKCEESIRKVFQKNGPPCWRKWRLSTWPSRCNEIRLGHEHVEFDSSSIVSPT